ncbi:MAG: class I SAM-dependent methyltransferase [Chloroflexi bacterium]|nr:class I SAM-dependent methyltransferase [Chloroflexota bacterium]
MTEVAPDGSPVAFCRGLPATGEPELIHRVIAPGASVLDLGCGPGRIAAPLASLGHRVAGVDNGAAMIRASAGEDRGCRRRCRHRPASASVRSVLLASHLLNDPMDVRLDGS